MEDIKDYSLQLADQNDNFLKKLKKQIYLLKEDKEFLSEQNQILKIENKQNDEELDNFKIKVVDLKSLIRQYKISQQQLLEEI